jgi:thiamine-phosphate pyrophosphorylase
VDRALCEARGLDPLVVADAFLDGGAKLLQIRDKTPSSAARLSLADALVARCRAAGARLIVNDYADLARTSGADGVHVGQEDLPVEDARRIVGPDATVGVSTHTDAQIAAAARTTATYIAVGPIYGTATKDTGYTARGLHLIRQAASTGKPVVGIGGITIEGVAEVLAAGAASAAIISDLLKDQDIAGRVRVLLAALRV